MSEAQTDRGDSMDSEDPVVLTEIRGEVGVVTLNRPGVRNALDLAVRNELQEALERLDADTRVLAVVLTGAGGNFCSGRDLKAAAAGEPLPPRSAQIAAFTRVSIGKPVIAAIEGYALAGGFELALSCDLLVASRDAVFGLPEVKRNLVAVGGGLIRLPRRVPYHLAMEMALTGDHVPAERLAAHGLFARLTEPGETLANAVALADSICECGPSSVRATKEILRQAYEWSGEREAFDAQFAIAQPAVASADRREGIAAFLEKRAPVWKDR